MNYSVFSGDAYGPAIRPIVGSWIKPERRTLFLFRFRWPWIRFFIVETILLAAITESYGGSYFAVAAFVYLIWFLLTSLLKGQRFNLLSLEHINLLSHVLVIIAVAFMYLFGGNDNSLIWLLFYIPIVSIGVELSRRWAFPVIYLSVLSLFVSTLWFSSDQFHNLASINVYLSPILRTAVLLYLGFTSYVISRSLAYVQRLNEKLISLLPNISALSDWSTTSSQATRIISEIFSEGRDPVVVNILSLHQQNLYLSASSTTKGIRLAKSAFHFPIELGVTGYVARTKKSCFINNVDADPENRFLDNQAFPNIKAEMAAPIMVNSAVVGIVDVESNQKNIFGAEDMNILELICAYLSEVYRQAESLKRYKELADISTKFAKHAATTRDFGLLLLDIGRIARDLFKADLIGFYCRVANSENIKGPYISGELLRPELTREPMARPATSLIKRLLKSDEVKIYMDAMNDQDLTSNSGTNMETKVEKPPFVVRERIMSSAAVPLRVGGNDVGLMFINFRKAYEFNEEFQYLIETLAPLAALAIQNGLQQESIEVYERGKLIKDFHDSFSHKLLAAETALDNLSKKRTDSPSWLESLMAAKKYIKSLGRMIRDIQSGKNAYSLEAVLKDLWEEASLIKALFGVVVNVSVTSPLDNKPLISWTGRELQFALDEALYNAVKHSQASIIDITVTLTKERVTFIIKDNGVGMDTADISFGSGILNMQDRIKGYLGGSFSFISAINQGTEIIMEVPILLT